MNEALPLPLVVLFRFEQALVNGAGDDCLLLSVLLVMAWGDFRDLGRRDALLPLQRIQNFAAKKVSAMPCACVVG